VNKIKGNVTMMLLSEFKYEKPKWQKIANRRKKMTNAEIQKAQKLMDERDRGVVRKVIRKDNTEVHRYRKVRVTPKYDNMADATREKIYTGHLFEAENRYKKANNIPIASQPKVTDIPSKSTTRSYTFRDMQFWDNKKKGLAAVGLIGLGAASYGVYKYMNNRKQNQVNRKQK
jgi:hypothetical protein